MILCTGINHCLCDGIGTSQFLHAWAHLTTKPTAAHLPVSPFHDRHVLKPRTPPHPTFTHPQFSQNAPPHQSQYQSHCALAPASLTFSASHILHLKRQCFPSLKCTAFEALAAHTWRSWARSLDLAPTLHVKLLFSLNFRTRVDPHLPPGFYGNAFVLACAEAGVRDLAASNLRHGVRLVQQAKASVTDGYVRSAIDLLEDKTVKTEVPPSSLVISQWSKLGLEELDFGEGKPLHMGPLTSDIYCLFLPVAGDSDAVRVLVSLPECAADKFEYFMTGSWGSDKEDDVVDTDGLCQDKY